VADERRNQIVRDILLVPLDVPKGWASAAHEWETDLTRPPWAISVIYEAARTDDPGNVLHTPLSISFVEIEHYTDDDVLRTIVNKMRNATQQNQLVMIEQFEARDGRRRSAASS
jgi:hypothetical protein